MSNFDQDPRPQMEQLPAGRYAICACGSTSRPPYCDGSHAGSGVTPQIVEVEPPGKTIAWCTCRTSDKLPMCDGSHKALWPNPPPPKE